MGPVVPTGVFDRLNVAKVALSGTLMNAEAGCHSLRAQEKGAASRNPKLLESLYAIVIQLLSCSASAEFSACNSKA